MRLGGRLAAAIEILEQIEGRQRPASEALKDWGLSHRFAGAGDRAAIGNIVYDVLRRKRSAGWLLDADTPRALGFGALLLDGMAPSALNAELEGDRFAPALLDAAELETIDRQRARQAPDAVAADCPDWCTPLLQRAYGNAWVEEAKALSARPPLDLRVNTLKSSTAKVLAELARTGAEPTEIALHGLRVPPIRGYGRHPNLQLEPAFLQGWFEVQDEGSQVVAALAGAQVGTSVLDFCAGAGGKTLAMAAAMENTGTILVHDSEKQRLAPIFERLARSGVSNVEAVSRLDVLDERREGFDLVLVDAPCTGSGTWRRRPDAKWRLSERQLEIRMNEQSGILDRVAAFVKPGGCLAYVTCSVFEEENGDQVSAFLDRTPGWSADDHALLWSSHFPGKTGGRSPADRAYVSATGGIRLSPRLTGTDGFYFAALRRDRD